MATEWFTARELAGQPGMTSTRRRVNAQASREGWQWRERNGKGGGREYHVSSLPEETRVELAKAALADAVATLPTPTRDLAAERAKAQEAGLAKFATLSPKKRDRAYARRELLRLSDQFVEAGTLRRREGLDLFCVEYSSGRIEAAEHVRAVIKTVDRATLYRWSRAERENGLAGLAGRRADRMRSKIASCPELCDIIIGLIAKEPHIKPVRAWEYLEADHGELLARVGPSAKAVERYMKRWKRENPATFCLATNPDRYKSQFQAAFGSASESIRRLNQLWELDATPADVMLEDGRHSILGTIDIYSRRLKLLVSKTSKATAVSLLFRRCLLDWGVPHGARIDNGKEYVSQHFMGVLDGLDIDALICVPFASEQKPFIERVFRTFSHGLLELKPGFIGHNVAERKAIEARKSFAQRLMKSDEVIDVKMSSAQLQAFCDQWCESVYAHAPHAGLNGRTPFEVAAAWVEPVRRIENERALDLLLCEAPSDAGGRPITKKGVRVQGGRYIADELAGRVGERVMVRMDPTDLGKIVVFSGAGEDFICVAVCPEREGISPKAIATAAKVRQARERKAGRKLLKQAKRAVTSRDIGQSILDHKIEQARKLSLLPRQGESYSTAQLEAAAEAAASMDGTLPPPEYDEEAVTRGAEIIELFNEEDRQREEQERRDAEHWPKYWQAKNGEAPMTKEIADWMVSYERSSDFESKLFTANELGGELRRQMQPKKKASGVAEA